METIPDVGARVSYAGGLTVGRCSGIIKRIYPDFNPTSLRQTPFDPETWHVSVEVDEQPTPWCYGKNKRFAPSISEVEPE